MAYTIPINPRQASGHRLIAERTAANEVISVRIYVPGVVARAVGDALGSAAGPITDAVYAGMKGGVFPDSRMLAANKELAERAQQAIVTGWRARLPVKSPPYRRGANPKKDRLSGKLGEALASGDMTAGTTPRAISFLNKTRLDIDARHWYRVNYGALGRRVPAIRKPKAHPVTVGGHTLFALQDEALPAPRSFLPKHFIFQDNQFIPMGPVYDDEGEILRAGGGHRAALFTELGFKAVADNVDPVYRAMLFRYFRGGGLQARYQAKGVTRHVTSKGHVR